MIVTKFAVNTTLFVDGREYIIKDIEVVPTDFGFIKEIELTLLSVDSDDEMTIRFDQSHLALPMPLPMRRLRPFWHNQRIIWL